MDESENERLRAEVSTLRRQASDAAAGTASRAGLEIRFEELDVRDRVGGGGFSVVYRAMWHGTPVAVKRFEDEAGAVGAGAGEAQAEFNQELLGMRDLRHPHVVQLLGACMRPPDICLVMEYMPYSLHHLLHEQSDIPIDRKRSLALSGDVARAFCYLHSREPPVVHRDVKPANFLVDRAWRLKLCDFGLAFTTNRAAGTPAYMAPELLEGRAYNESVDVYAFGCMLWEMLAVEVPWDGLGPADIKQRVCGEGLRPKVPLSCPQMLKGLVQDLWAQAAGDRPAFPEVADRLKECAAER